jgi:hypothetical protein
LTPALPHIRNGEPDGRRFLDVATITGLHDRE